MMHLRSFGYLCVVVLFGLALTEDYYVDEIRNRCYATNRTLPCAKYSVLNYIDNYEFSDYDLTSDSSVTLVTIPGANVSHVEFFGTSREYSFHDSEMYKMFKFLYRQVDKFLNKQGLSVNLPEGARIFNTDNSRIGDAKGKKQKLKVLLPFLIILKLCKIKVLTSLIFVGVLIIKKMLLYGALTLPGIIAAIKAHCKAQYQVVPYHVEDEHFHHEHEDVPGNDFALTGYADKHQHFWDRNHLSNLVNLKKKFSVL